MRNTKCVSKRFALDESEVHPHSHTPATAAPQTRMKCKRGLRVNEFANSQ